MVDNYKVMLLEVRALGERYWQNFQIRTHAFPLVPAKTLRQLAAKTRVVRMGGVDSDQKFAFIFMNNLK